MITIKIKNANQIATAFKKVPRKMSSELAIAIKKSAFLVERESKKVTPVDTGRLRASIISSIMPMTATIAPHTDYAYTVHEGKGYGRNSTPRKFMQIGANKTEKDMADLFERAVINSLKNI